MKKYVLALCSLGFMASASAQLTAPDAGYQQIHEQFSQLNLKVNAVAEAPLDGITRAGYRLTYTDSLTPVEKRIQSGESFDTRSEELDVLLDLQKEGESVGGDTF